MAAETEEAPAPEPHTNKAATVDEPPAGEPMGEEAAQPDRAERRTASVNNQIAALKRQQRQWQQQYTSQRDEVQRERQALEHQVNLLRKARDEAKSNPEEWLRQGGIDHSRVQEFYKGREGHPPHDARFDSLSRDIQALKSALTERDQKLQQYEAQTNQYQEDRILDTVQREVKAGGDAYELINHYEAYPDVAQCQALYFEKTGQRMDTAEAAERVENILTSMREEEVKKALASPKLAKRLGWEPKNPDDEAAAEAKVTSPTQPPPKRGLQKPKPRPDKKDAKRTPEELWRDQMRRATGKDPQL